jgi:predicted ATPase with chaperone activity
VRPLWYESKTVPKSLWIALSLRSKYQFLLIVYTLQDEGQSLMRAAMTQLNLSARAYHRILKLARTIADLARSEEIQSVHLAEALQYRPKLIMG